MYYLALFHDRAPAMTPEAFVELIAPIARHAAGRRLDDALEDDLNRAVPHDSAAFSAICAACRDAIAAGWMCNREAGCIRYGRVVKAGPAMHGFSVDVVEMDSLAGPHHRHPNGEIDLIMPLSPSAKFDGRGAGFLVYAAGSAHSPTVTGGKALVLYLLPGGAIEFTGTQ
jgi:hypothetical protein